MPQINLKILDEFIHLPKDEVASVKNRGWFAYEDGLRNPVIKIFWEKIKSHKYNEKFIDVLYLKLKNHKKYVVLDPIDKIINETFKRKILIEKISHGLIENSPYTYTNCNIYISHSTNNRFTN